MKKIIVFLAAFTCLVTVKLYAFDDPFDTPPADVARNCSREYRFRYNEIIRSPEAFIEFLKKHQGGKRISRRSYKGYINSNVSQT